MMFTRVMSFGNKMVASVPSKDGAFTFSMFIIEGMKLLPLHYFLKMI